MERPKAKGKLKRGPVVPEKNRGEPPTLGWNAFLRGAELSDGQIAEHVGVHLNTVAKYRAELTADGTTTNCVSRTGRDGRTINTANIGRRATSGDTEGPQPEAEMSPCHHCGGEHPIGGFNPCHDAAEQVATVLADDVAPELSTILWADYVRPAVQKWIDEWEGASGILASALRGSLTATWLQRPIIPATS